MDIFREIKRNKQKLDISVKPINTVKSEVIEKMVNWENDPEIQSLIFPKRDESSELVTWTQESMLNRHKDFENQPTYLIFDNETPIGVTTYRFNFPLLLCDEDDSAWISITIGDKSYWRKGVGSLVLEHLEQKCQENGAKRIELGVFEFNSGARKFYEKMGYREIGQIPNFVYFNNRMWNDIRMEKVLLV